MNKGILGPSRLGYGLDYQRTQFAKILADQTTSSTTYVDLATVGPRIIIKESGDYIIEHGAYQWNTSASSGVSSFTSLAVNGATAASDADAFQVDNDNRTSLGHSGKRVQKKTLAVGDVLTLKHRSSNGVTCHFTRRFLKVTKIA